MLQKIPIRRKERRQRIPIYFHYNMFICKSQLLRELFYNFLFPRVLNGSFPRFADIFGKFLQD